MNTWFGFAILTFLTWAGFVVLSLSQDRHYEEVLGAADVPPRQRQGLLVVGWVLLLLSLIFAVWLQGLGIGLTLWAVVLMVSAVVQALTLTYWPQRLRPLFAFFLNPSQ